MKASSLTFAQNKYAAIEFPGHVVDTERALSMLGGPARLSQGFSEESRFIELRYRPEATPCVPLAQVSTRQFSLCFFFILTSSLDRLHSCIPQDRC